MLIAPIFTHSSYLRSSLFRPPSEGEGKRVSMGCHDSLALMLLAPIFTHSSRLGSSLFRPPSEGEGEGEGEGRRVSMGRCFLFFFAISPTTEIGKGINENISKKTTRRKKAKKASIEQNLNIDGV